MTPSDDLWSWNIFGIILVGNKQLPDPKFNCPHQNPEVLPFHDDVIKMETFFASLALCAGKSPVRGEFPAQWPVTQSFDVFFDLRLNKRLSKQS